MSYLLYKLSNDDRANAMMRAASIDGSVVSCSPIARKWFIALLKVGGAEFLKAVIFAIWCRWPGKLQRPDHTVWTFIDRSRRILHYSIVIPTEMHFPWMRAQETGLEIGACITIPEARGKRIYPYVLSQIASAAGNRQPIYMIVESANAASKSGMERAGFKVHAKLRKRRRIFGPPVYEATMDDIESQTGKN